MLITFESTTAAFRAKKYIEDFMPHIADNADIVALPFDLTKTCYGNGLAVKISDDDAKKLVEGLKTNKIGVKHYWAANKHGKYEVVDDQFGHKGA